MKKGLAVVFILALLIVLPVLNGNFRTGASAEVADDTPTATVFCPSPSPEPFYVDPLTSPTKLDQQDVYAYLGNGEVITVSLESGVYSGSGPFWPAVVNVPLLENTTHQLQVEGRVKEISSGGCMYGGYTLSTMVDRVGQPLVIQQVNMYTYFPFALREAELP